MVQMVRNNSVPRHFQAEEAPSQSAAMYYPRYFKDNSKIEIFRTNATGCVLIEQYAKNTELLSPNAKSQAVTDQMLYEEDVFKTR